MHEMSKSISIMSSDVLHVLHLIIFLLISPSGLIKVVVRYVMLAKFNTRLIERRPMVLLILTPNLLNILGTRQLWII